MGAGEEPIIPECVVLNNEKTAHDPEDELQQFWLIRHKTAHDPEDKPQQFWHVRHKTVFLVVLIVSMMVAIIVLAVKVSLVRNTDDKQITTIKEAMNQIYAPCEDDWIWYQGKCYYFSKKSATWDNSQKFCISHNASLAHIDNQKEMDFLNWLKGSDNCWIGLRRTDDNKAWIWTNETLYNESLFTIKRSLQENVEYVYLNHQGVKSNARDKDFKWICNKM